MMNKENNKNIDWQRIHDLLDNDIPLENAGQPSSEADPSLLKDITDIRSAAKELPEWDSIDLEADWTKVQSRITPSATTFRIPAWQKISRYAAVIISPLLLTGGALWFLNRNNVNYTTLTTPPGNAPQQVTLPDGSTAWLNAGSRLRYPATFTGDNRQVEIEGEVSFAIAPDNKHPFIAKVQQMKIQVLGTLFNVNAYEPIIYTTLINGRVVIETTGKNPAQQYLEPGQQAAFNTATGELRVTNIDTLTATAWKKNELYFPNLKLNELLNQIGRLYNYKIVFENNALNDLHYNVPLMPKPADVNVLLTLIKSSIREDIHFKIDQSNRIITVQ